MFLSDKVRSEIAPKVSQLIKEHIGPDLPTVVATRKEVQEMLDMNPFIGENYDIARVFFTLTNSVLANDLVEKFTERNF